MGYTKWIGAFLGYVSGGTLGALAGFALGTLFDTFTKSSDASFESNTNRAYDNTTA